MSLNNYIFNNGKRQLNKAAVMLVLIIMVIAAFVISLRTGKYPLTLKGILSGDTMQIKVLVRLRIPRAVMGVAGGFGLGIAGCVYQLVFKNPLASPDIVGVSSGASAGAAMAIVFISSVSSVVSAVAFAAAMLTLIVTLLIAYLVPGKNSYTIVLSGIAIHSLAQTVLMFIKLAADPEKQLASIEYWIMGSLNSVSVDDLLIPCIVTFIGTILIILLYRQLLMLSLDEDEAASLGVHIVLLRLIVLVIATLIVSVIICTTGLISFIGLLAPHIAGRLIKNHNISLLMLSGISGSLLLTLADILARSVTSSELPVSIFTSLLGAPLLIILLLRNRQGNG